MAATAYVVVVNNQKNSLKSNVENQICMQDKVTASNPSYFNNLTIPAHSTMPPKGKGQTKEKGQTIAVKDWDTGLDNCVASSSSFDIVFYSESDVPIGTAAIYERYSNWWVTVSNKELLLTDISQGNDVVITITVQTVAT